MEALTRLCAIRDPQISALRSMTLRRSMVLARFSGIGTGIVFVLNLFCCGYFEQSIFSNRDSLAAFFLVESCAMTAGIVLHGSVYLQEVLARANFLGVPSSKKLGFAFREFALHPLVIAQLLGLLAAWIIVFKAQPVLLGVTCFLLLAWWGSTVACTTAIFLVMMRIGISPLAFLGSGAVCLFLVLTGPTVLSGSSPYTLIPVAGWIGRSMSAALAGDVGLSLLWLVPTVTLPGILLPFCLKQG